MLTLPNFERLKVFHVVYLNRSIQKAADLMSVTRSAVSQSLKGLEGELKAKLFIRDSKRFLPTPEADTLFQTIDPFVSELHGALQKMDAGLRTPVGHLRIGAPMDFGSGVLTGVIGEFRKKFPDVTFELLLNVPTKQLEALCEGKLDIAFIDNGDVHAVNYPVAVQNLVKEEFVLVASAAFHKKHGLANARFDDLARLPFVDYLHHAPVARMWFKHHFSKEPAKLNTVFSAESVHAVLNAVRGEIGVGVVPSRLIAGAYGGLKRVETSRAGFINQIMMARRLGKRATAREREFMEFCRGRIAK